MPFTRPPRIFGGLRGDGWASLSCLTPDFCWTCGCWSVPHCWASEPCWWAWAWGWRPRIICLVGLLSSTLEASGALFLECPLGYSNSRVWMWVFPVGGPEEGGGPTTGWPVVVNSGLEIGAVEPMLRIAPGVLESKPAARLPLRIATILCSTTWLSTKLPRLKLACWCWSVSCCWSCSGSRTTSGSSRVLSSNCLLRLTISRAEVQIFLIAGPGKVGPEEGGGSTAGWPVACCCGWLLVAETGLGMRSEKLILELAWTIRGLGWPTWRACCQQVTGGWACSGSRMSWVVLGTDRAPS